MQSQFLVLIVFLCSLVHAEEGMWPFNMIPHEKLQKQGITLEPEWLSHLQKSSLRISSGGSGSFVSSKGLVLTNHHVGFEAIYSLSTEERNLVEEGFYAPSYDQELKCPGMYVDQLISIIDITDQIHEATQGITSPADREKAQKEATARIKDEQQKLTSLQPQVVMLYGGALYHLYLYKRYTDVRLVFAPEKKIASFGGDHDNFEFPRYDLDVCFFRVYDSDQPLVTDHYLKWSASGPHSLEFLFVSGNPGHTERLYTAAHLTFFNNLELPLILQWVSKKIKALESFSQKSPENRRIASEQLARLMNTFKALKGIQQGFATSDIIQKKKKQEASETALAVPFQNIEEALEKAKPYYPSYMILEGSGSNYSTLYRWAKQLVRLFVELKKPNAERLKEYTDTEIPTLKLDLFSSKPIYPSLEQLNLTCGLENLKAVLGPKSPITNPRQVAEECIKGTRMADKAYREDLFAHLEKIATSSDPLIQLALKLDPPARELRQKIETELDSVKKASYAQITEVLFKQYGESLYPDGTFTLRLSIGTVKGYQEKKDLIKPMTTIGGTFQHAQAHGSKGEFELPPSWTLKSSTLATNTTPFNFVSTHDIIGGNSGSPMVNMKGEFVGLIFDGNIYSLIWDYQYNDLQGRAISVHSQAILESLEKIYDAKPLVMELSN